MTSNIQMQSAFTAIEVFNHASLNYQPLWIRKSGDLRKATHFEKFTLKIMEAFKIWPNWKIQAREQIYKKMATEITVMQSLKDAATEEKVKNFVNEITADSNSSDQINTKIEEINKSDMAFGAALNFAHKLKKFSFPENYQSILNVAKYIKGVDLSMLDEMNKIGAELNSTYRYSKKEAISLAPLTFLLKRELTLDLRNALKVSNAALKLSKKTGEPPLICAKKLIEYCRKLNSALPKGYNVQELITADFKIDLKIAGEDRNVFLEFLKESAGDSISLNDEIPDFCLKDLNRNHIKFKTGGKEKYLGPGHQNEMIEEITNLDSNATVRSTLCKAIFQAGGNGIITSYSQIFAKKNNQLLGLLNFCPEKDDEGAKAHFEISIEKNKSGNFTISYTLYEKHLSLVDPESGENYPINGNFGSSKPASKNDFTGFSKFIIELNHSDLALGLYNPEFISSTIDLTIKPNFMI